MKRLIILVLGLIIASCAAAPKAPEVKPRYFWPPPPNDPKIEFIGLYSSSKDLPKKKTRLTAITGDTEQEIRLRKPLGIGSDGEGVVIVTDLVPWGGYIWDFNNNIVTPITDEAAFQLSSGVAFDSERFYIADARAGNVKVFARKNRAPLYVIGDEELQSPNGIAVNEKLKRLYVVDTKGFKVVVFDLVTRKKLFEWGKPGDMEGEFNRPWGICIDKNDDVIVADGLNARIQIFDKDGKFITMFGKRSINPGGFAQVKGVGVDSDGNIYVIDPLKAIQIFNRDGELLGLVGGPGTKGLGAMNLPMGLYIDKNDRIYTVDQMNRRFYIFQYMNEEYKKKYPIEPPTR